MGSESPTGAEFFVSQCFVVRGIGRILRAARRANSFLSAAPAHVIYTRRPMPSRDYYEVLGVSRSANAEEIRRAHRKLALQFHPDRNKEKSAVGRFNEIQQAYEVVSDEDKRKRYDEYIRLGGTTEGFAAGAGSGPAAGAGQSPFGGAWSGQQRAGEPWTRADTETFDTIFSDVFSRGNRRGPSRPQRERASPHIVYEMAVPLEKILKGGKLAITIDDKRYEIEIPVGIENEELVSVPGRLDAVVRVHADSHSWITRDERDLSYSLPLSIVEATLGATIDAPLPTGGSVSLKIPPGTASGKKLRITGKGVPAANGKPAGDLYVEVQIVPPKEVNELTASLLKEIANAIDNPRARIGHLRA